MDDRDIENLDLDAQDIQRLQIFERELMQREKWLQKAIKTIGEQCLALQVESLTIKNILNAEQRELNKQAENKVKGSIEKDLSDNKNQHPACFMEEMDSAKSSMNTKTLDLSVDALIDDIIMTQAKSKDSESETEQEEMI